jgi:hypothetical protein
VIPFPAPTNIISTVNKISSAGHKREYDKVMHGNMLIDEIQNLLYETKNTWHDSGPISKPGPGEKSTEQQQEVNKHIMKYLKYLNQREPGHDTNLTFERPMYKTMSQVEALKNTK